MTRAFVLALFGVACVSWLSLAALYLVALRRAGSAWTPGARLWVRLKVIEYGLLLLFVASAAVGVPSRGLLVMAIPLVVIAFVRHRIRQRAAEWPPQWIDGT